MNSFHIHAKSHKMIFRPVFLIFLFINFSTLTGQNTNDKTSIIDTSEYIAGDIDFNLIIAADRGYENEVIRLLANGANANARTYEGVTPLLYATQNNDTKICTILLANGADPDLMAYNNIPAIVIAVMNGNLDVAELMIRKDANLNAQDKNGMTPLMHAVALNDFEMCDMLLYYDASVNIQDKEGNTALIAASFYGYDDIVELLIKNKATLERTDYIGYTPLHCAAQNGNIDVAGKLVKSGAGLELKNNAGYSPLSLAVLNNNSTMTRFLLEKGSNPNSKINYALRPLNLSINQKNDTIFNYLKEKGAKRSYTPLFNYSSIDFSFNISNEDLLLGFGYSRYDTRYGLLLNAGYSIRVKAISILSQAGENTYYQYWERRSYLHLGLEERIHLFSWNKKNSAGIGIGGQAQIHFARYRGTTVKPKKGIILVPDATAFVKLNAMILSLKYQYIDLETKGNANNRFNVGIHFLIRSKQLKQQAKKALWNY